MGWYIGRLPMQNRIEFGTPCFSTTHPRRQLHWHPVRQRIIFKILTFIFKCVHSEAPVYLCELIQSYNPSRLLRSSSGNSLVVPRTSSKLADRGFSVCGPTLWNSLPKQIRLATSCTKFRKLLKTHLFKTAYLV